MILDYHGLNYVYIIFETYMFIIQNADQHYIISEYIQRHLANMEMQADSHNLLLEFKNLSLGSQQIQNQHLEAQNTIIAKQMPWQQLFDIIDQYNRIYIDRMKNLCCRIPFTKHRKIEEIEESLGNIKITGMIKRLEVKRVRAFEKGFNEYYQNTQKIYSEDDELQIEDLSGKVKFRFSKNITFKGKQLREIDLPYGIVVGLSGRFSEKQSKFIVSSITFPETPPQKTFLPIKSESNLQTLFISKPSVKELQFILEEIKGSHISCISFNSYRNIKNIIIIGLDDGFSAQDFREADKILYDISNILDVFLVPQPNSYQLPKMPYHPIKFRKSKQNICLCHSPQFFTNQTSNLQMIICDEIILKDLKKNCAYSQDDLQLMKALLTFSHLVPTAPFSLKTQITFKDHMIINQLPHFMLVANCQETRQALFTNEGKKVKLVTLKEKGMLLFNQHTLQVMSFQIDGNYSQGIQIEK